jgi:hypothetical protein
MPRVRRTSLKIELALAGIGVALFAVSVQANGGDLPTAVEFKTPAVMTAPVSSTSISSPISAPISAPAMSARGLDELSPGNRLIAQALYSAQKAATTSGRQPWSLERVAVSRASGRNWGDVFQQMKQDGLIEAETLGQVVTWYQYHNVTPIRAARSHRVAGRCEGQSGGAGEIAGDRRKSRAGAGGSLL